MTDGEGWVASKPIAPKFGPQVSVSVVAAQSERIILKR